MKRTNNNNSQLLTAWIQLTKLLLCIPIALSSGFGFILYNKAVTADFFLLVPAMLLLATGAACLNSIQERKVDSRFERTRFRPLVTGKISIKTAFLCCALLLLLSFSLFSQLTISHVPLLLAATGIVLYNFAYTPLKPLSSFSLIIGGIAGALPPVIGWTAAGGNIYALPIILVATLFFLWQIPHFFMILLSNSEDYQKQYSTSLAAKLPEATIHRITIVWVFSYLVVSISLIFPLNFLANFSQASFILTALSQGVVVIWHLNKSDTTNYPYLFRLINGLFFGNMIVVSMIEIVMKQSL